MIAKSPTPEAASQRKVKPQPILSIHHSVPLPDEEQRSETSFTLRLPDLRQASTLGLCRFIDQVRASCDGIFDPGPVLHVPEGDVAAKTGRSISYLMKHIGGSAIIELRKRPEPSDPVEREHRARVLADPRGGL